MDLLSAGRLPSLAAALCSGRDLDLLRPLRLAGPRWLPERDPPLVDRAALAEALARANAAYGHAAGRELASRLAEPATRVVVTGQQPGLFGGPLYTLSKALAAVLWARRMEENGIPAVAVFWVATEDHDFAEVSAATFLTPEGPHTVDLGEDPAPLAPVGTRTLGPAVAGALEELESLMPGDRFAAWVRRLERWYRPDARFGEAFCRLLAGLLGTDCPLLLDSMLPEVKEAQQWALRRLVESRREVEEALVAADDAIRERDHPLQVTPQPGMSPLFLLSRGERRRVEWEGDGEFRLRGAEGPARPVAELERILDENPAVVSPGVLARPAVQDAILGTTLQVLGPAELSYLPQAVGLWEVLEVRPPTVALRPQILVLERHQREHMEELGLDLESLLEPSFDVSRAVAERRGEDPVRQLAGELEALLDRLRERVSELDPTLEDPWRKTRDQIGRSLETLAGKVDAAVARREDVVRGRIQGLRESCLPGDGLQERVVCIAHFPGKYGEAFVEAVRERLELDPARLQVVTP